MDCSHSLEAGGVRAVAQPEGGLDGRSVEAKSEKKVGGALTGYAVRGRDEERPPVLGPIVDEGTRAETLAVIRDDQSNRARLILESSGNRVEFLVFVVLCFPRKQLGPVDVAGSRVLAMVAAGDEGILHSVDDSSDPESHLFLLKGVVHVWRV